MLEQIPAYQHPLEECISGILLWLDSIPESCKKLKRDMFKPPQERRLSKCVVRVVYFTIYLLAEGARIVSYPLNVSVRLWTDRILQIYIIPLLNAVCIIFTI